ncbi:hypothetical protein [Methylophilus sp. Leaf414]|uniref:hypothetical protein n=1 Tax=Methylophilus sp. Leaf414 TaxID=1736371 RepID=UPI0006F8309B|nr:hypothetical protein [Methylophilus sp. Leaf414]KQT34155.1 hypothetical protein ASG24_10425 [Methylophilus sp. Leaf414]
MNIRVITVLFLLILVGSYARKSEADPANQLSERLLEAGLIKALSLGSEKERKAESGPALVAYIKQGYLRRKPDIQQDYNDYRFPLKLIHLLGHKVLLIDEENITKYIGCCVNEGLGITVDSEGPDLDSFAKNNGCSIRNNPYLPNEVKERLPKNGWFTLSCKANDAEL